MHLGSQDETECWHLAPTLDTRAAFHGEHQCGGMLYVICVLMRQMTVRCCVREFQQHLLAGATCECSTLLCTYCLSLHVNKL